MVSRFAHAEIHDRHEFLRPFCRGVDLQDGEIMPIKFLLGTPGGYEFAFAMGFCPGKLVVEQEV